MCYFIHCHLKSRHRSLFTVNLMVTLISLKSKSKTEKYSIDKKWAITFKHQLLLRFQWFLQRKTCFESEKQTVSLFLEVDVKMAVRKTLSCFATKYFEVKTCFLSFWYFVQLVCLLYSNVACCYFLLSCCWLLILAS